jgi:hypothetical protein
MRSFDVYTCFDHDRSHLQEATVLDICGVLCHLLAVSGEYYVHIAFHK